MRTYNSEIVNIQYPNEICFIFSPQIIRVKNAKNIKTQITCDGNTYEENRDGYNNEVVIDIRRYLQMFFANENLSDIDYSLIEQNNPHEKEATIILAITNKNGSLEKFNFTIKLIYGALDYGEEYGGTYNRKLYTAFPQSVTLITDGQSKIYNANLAATISGDKATLTKPSDILLNDNITSGTTTFNFEVETCDKGIYLRWLNRHGDFDYYLFKRLAETHAITKNIEFNRFDMVNTSSVTNGINITTPTRQYLDDTDTLKIAAPFVNSETYNYLIEMAKSPLIDYYDNGVWVRININTATYTKTTKDLQSFTATLKFAPKNSILL